MSWELNVIEAIPTAIRACKLIYEYCFTSVHDAGKSEDTKPRSNELLASSEAAQKLEKDVFTDQITNLATDQQYLQFGQDVAGLGAALEGLNSCLPAATHWFNGPGIPSGSSHGDILKREAERFIGDYNATLNKCKEILRDNESFRWKAGFIRNVIWSNTTANTITAMRNRICFHTTRINQIVSCLQLGVQNRIAARVEDIWTYLLPNLQGHQASATSLIAIPIPESAIRKIQDAFMQKPPPPCVPGVSIEDVPLEVAFDVIFYHRLCANLDAGPTSPRDIMQNLHVLKLHWLVNNIQRNRALQDERFGSLYRTWLDQTKALLIQFYEIKTIPLIENDQLQMLQSASFLLGYRDPINIFTPLSELQEREIKILTVSLARSSDLRDYEVVVTRRNDELRLLRIDLSTGKPEYVAGHASTDLSRDCYNPRYAFSSGATENLSVEICPARTTRGETLTFRSLGDLKEFQRAITNCEIYYETLGVSWTLSHRSRFRSRQGKGRIQIWHWNPIHPFPGGPELPQQSSTIDKKRTRTNSTAQSSKLSSQKSTHRLSVYEHYTRRLDAHSESRPILRPYVPMLLLFHKTRQEEMVACIDLKLAIDINEGLCDCARNYTKCRSMVIEKKWPNRSSHEPFDAHFISTTQSRPNEPASVLNVGLFGLPAELGGEDHSRLDSTPTVATTSYTLLNLDFGSAKQRHKFSDKLIDVLEARDGDENEFRELRDQLRHISNTPNLGDQTRLQDTRTNSRQMSIISSSTQNVYATQEVISSVS